MASSQDDSDTENESAHTAAETQKKKSTTTKRTARSTTKNDDQDEQQSTDDPKKRDTFTSTLERGLRRRLNGMVFHAQFVGTPKGVNTVSDYVNQAVAEKLARDEKRLNNGQPFPEPANMKTGAPKKRR